MSQIPNTTLLETPVAATAIGRRDAIAVPQIGIQGSLNAPGLAVMPPDSEGARLAEDALQALGLVGQVANTARVYSDRAQALQEGQGNNDAEADIPGITQKIAAGEIARLDGMTSAEQAELVIGAYTKGLPESVAAGYRKRATYAIASAFSQRDAQIVKDAQDLSLVQAGGLAEAAKTPEELTRAFEVAKSIGNVSELDARRATYLAALESKAQAGDPKGFEMVLSQMPGTMFTAEKRRYRETLDRELYQRAAINEKKAADTIGGMLYDVQRGKGSFEQVDAKLAELAPGISGSSREILLNKIQSERSQYDKATKDAMISRFSADAGDQFSAHLADLDSKGILSTAESTTVVLGKDGKIRVNDPTIEGGTTLLSVSKEDAIRMQTRAAFEAFDKQSDRDPALAMRLKLQWASRQGVAPPQWGEVLHAGMSAATLPNAITNTGYSAGNDSQSKDFIVSPNTVAGIELYRNMRALAPNNMHQLIKDERTRDFYDAVLTAESVSQVGSPATSGTPEAAQARMSQAVLTASRVMDGRSAVAIDPKTIQETVSSRLNTANWWALYLNGEKPVNGGEIGNEVGKYMSFYARLGKDAPSALKAAEEHVFSERVMMPGGWSVSLAGLPIKAVTKQDLRPLAKSIIADWYKAEGKAAGQKEEQLTFAPDPKTGWWAIRTLDGFPVESKSAAGVVFAPHQLDARHTAWQKQTRLDADAAARKTKAEVDKAIEEFGERQNQFDLRHKQ